jgi:cytochrome b involved in lipid metabolism
MNNKVLYVIIGVVVVGLVVWAAMSSQPSAIPSGEENGTSTTSVTSSTPSDTSSSTPISSSTGSTGVKSYTLGEVGTHKNATSCWSAINGNVYDLTQWISQHPGGEQAILSICGKDGSAAFNGQHGGMQKQAQILATFKIGVLAK